MPVPLEIAFQDIPTSDAVEQFVEEEAARKFENHQEWFTNIKVVLSEPHRHRHRGRQFACHIFVPLTDGGELVVNKDHGDDHSHEDIYAAIRDSFDIAARQLRIHMRKRRNRNHAH